MERATISRQQQTQRAFLGAALMDPARAREYIIKLVPGMFDEGVSRAVFSAVQQLTMAGEPVDVITVINRASAGRPADEIRPGVVAMAETCPSVSNVGSYAAQILEDYRYSLTMHQREVWAKMNDEIGRLLGGYLKTLKQ